MVKILLILMQEDTALPAEQYLLKKGYEPQIAETIEESQSAIQSEAMDAFIIDPFSDYSSSAFILNLLKEFSLLHRTILIGNDLNRLKAIQQKLNCGGILLNKTNYSLWEEAIAQIQALNKSPYEDSAYLYKTKIQFLKSELEKAKRGHTSISFLFFQIKNKLEQNIDINEILIQKILINANYRLRISDEAMILNNGVLITLFGTLKKDRQYITDLIKKRIKRNLKHLNLHLSQFVNTSEATYPDDSNNIDDILKLLEQVQSSVMSTERKKGSLIHADLHDWLSKRSSNEEVCRTNKSLLKSVDPSLATTTRSLPLPPIWFINLAKLLESPDSSPRIFETEFLKQCPFHEKVLNCARGLIENNKHLQHEYDNVESLDTKQILLILGAEELKNILTWSCLQNTVFKNFDFELTPIREFSTMVSCFALELSEKLDYQHKSEALLLSALQNINLIILKIGYGDLFDSFISSKNTPFSVLAKNCHESLGVPYSELSVQYLSKWNLSESLLDSLKCSRYETTPKMNPQLVALTFLATALVNHLSGLSLQGSLYMNQLAWDELQLRNRNLSPESFEEFNDFDLILKKHSYLYIN